MTDSRVVYYRVTLLTDWNRTGTLTVPSLLGPRVATARAQSIAREAGWPGDLQPVDIEVVDI